MTQPTGHPSRPNSYKTEEVRPNGGTVRWPIRLFILAVVIIVLVAALMLVGLVIAPFWLWLLIAGVMVILLIALGLQVKQHVLGVLIDSRNRISLSRFQTTLWTILVLSAFLAIALPRCLPFSGTSSINQPLNITIPTDATSITVSPDGYRSGCEVSVSSRFRLLTRYSWPRSPRPLRSAIIVFRKSRLA